MQTNIPLLDNVRVAAPCHADWSLMEGDDRSRHCLGCNKRVYNLSSLSRNEAEALIREHEGRLCVRYFQRPDGTVMTDNCPVGLRRLRSIMIRRAGAVVSLVALLFPWLSRFAVASPQATTGAPVAHPNDVNGESAVRQPIASSVRDRTVHPMGFVSVRIGEVAVHRTPKQVKPPQKGAKPRAAPAKKP